MAAAPKQQSIEAALAATWEPLRIALEEVNDVVAGRKTTVSKSNFKDQVNWYTHVYNATAHQQELTGKLYNKLKDWIPEMLQSSIQTEIQRLSRLGDGESMVRFIAKTFDSFKISMRFGCIAFSYLDRFHTKQQKTLLSGKKIQLDPVKTLYLKAFHKVTFEAVQQHLLPFILRQVNARRNGDAVDMSLIKAGIEIFTKVGTILLEDTDKTQFITEHFDKPYISKLVDWYRAKSASEFEREGGHLTYLDWVEKRMTLETQFVGDFLSSQSGSAVKTACVECMLQPLYQRIVSHPVSGFRVLFVEGRKDKASAMFRMLTDVPQERAVTVMAAEFQDLQLASIRQLRSAYENASQTSGGADAVSHDKVLVDSLIQTHAEALAFVAECKQHKTMHQAVKKAFEDSVKAKFQRKETRGETTETKEIPFAEILAAYVDGLMRREFKDIDTDQEADRIDSLVTLFSFVTDKDVFQVVHQNKLARRLLQTTPVEDLEKAFLERLQRMMGKSYTFKLEGMLHDRVATKDTADKFANDASSKGLPSEISVQVLTAGNWPAFRSDAFVAPASLRPCVESFIRFFRKLYPMRKLIWINSLSTCTVNVAFPKGTKEVAATVFQGSILEVVDQRAQLSPTAMAALFQLDAKTIKAQIASMYIAKGFQLLSRVDESGAVQPVGKTIGDNDLFAMNADFVHKLRRFKLPTAVAVTSTGTTQEEVDDSRKVHVDACIVRVMKSRRTLPFRDLQDLVIEQLSKYFVPQPKMIKQRVEDLVVRAYLQRDEADNTLFHYLA